MRCGRHGNGGRGRHRMSSSMDRCVPSIHELVGGMANEDEMIRIQLRRCSLAVGWAVTSSAANERFRIVFERRHWLFYCIFFLVSVSLFPRLGFGRKVALCANRWIVFINSSSGANRWIVFINLSSVPWKGREIGRVFFIGFLKYELIGLVVVCFFPRVSFVFVRKVALCDNRRERACYSSTGFNPTANRRAAIDTAASHSRTGRSSRFHRRHRVVFFCFRFFSYFYYYYFFSAFFPFRLCAGRVVFVAAFVFFPIKRSFDFDIVSARPVLFMTLVVYKYIFIVSFLSVLTHLGSAGPGFTEFYRVLPGCTEFYQVYRVFFVSDCLSSLFSWLLVDSQTGLGSRSFCFTEFYRVLPSFNGSYRRVFFSCPSIFLFVLRF